MTLLLTKLQNSLQNWPGRKKFGVYSLLPIFFVAGASLEFAMIHWKPNGDNFCKVFGFFHVKWLQITHDSNDSIADNTYKKSLAASLVDRKEYLAAEEAKNKVQQDTP